MKNSLIKKQQIVNKIKEAIFTNRGAGFRKKPGTAPQLKQKSVFLRCKEPVIQQKSDNGTHTDKTENKPEHRWII